VGAWSQKKKGVGTHLRGECYYMGVQTPYYISSMPPSLTHSPCSHMHTLTLMAPVWAQVPYSKTSAPCWLHIASHPWHVHTPMWVPVWCMQVHPCQMAAVPAATLCQGTGVACCIVSPQLWMHISYFLTGPLTLRWWHHSGCIYLTSWQDPSHSDDDITQYMLHSLLWSMAS